MLKSYKSRYNKKIIISMKKVILSKTNSDSNASLQSLIDENDLQSILGGTSSAHESIVDESAAQDSAYYRAIIPPTKR